MLMRGIYPQLRVRYADWYNSTRSWR